MKTTKTRNNIDKANRLLELRETIKELTKEEKALKAYFSDMIENDASLIVNTAIVISKHEVTRASWDNDKLKSYFSYVGQDFKNWQKTSTYSTIKLNKVG